MRVPYSMPQGSMLRQWYELSVRIEKVKREFGRLVGVDRGAPMRRRKDYERYRKHN